MGRRRRRCGYGGRCGAWLCNELIAMEGTWCWRCEPGRCGIAVIICVEAILDRRRWN